MKLASNPALKRKLENQAEIYQKAGDAQYAYKVILYYSAAEFRRVKQILRQLNLEDSPWIILTDGRSDNKPSASKAEFH